MSAGSSSTMSNQEGTLWDSNDPLNSSNYQRAVKHFGIGSQQIKDWYGKSQMYQMDSAHLETPEQSQLGLSLSRISNSAADTSKMLGLQSLNNPNSTTLGGA